MISSKTCHGCSRICVLRTFPSQHSPYDIQNQVKKEVHKVSDKRNVFFVSYKSFSSDSRDHKDDFVQISGNNIDKLNDSRDTKDDKSHILRIISSTSKDIIKGVSKVGGTVSDALGKIDVNKVKQMEMYVPSGSEVRDKVSNTIKSSMEVRKKKQMAKKREKELSEEKLLQQSSLLEQIENMNKSVLEAYSTDLTKKNNNNLSNNAEMEIDEKSQMEGGLKNLNKVSWFSDPRLRIKNMLFDTETSAKKSKKVVNIQRISKESIEKRTKELVYLLCNKAVSNSSKLTRTQNLCEHLLQYPDTRKYAKSLGAMATLLKIYHNTKDNALKQESCKALNLIGYCAPPRGRGIRILTIDGGGVRGLVALKTLRELEKGCGKPLHKVFDYVCGVSTGSLVASIIFMFQRSISECEELYTMKSKEMFTQGRVSGSLGLVHKASFYNSELWESILRDLMKEGIMIDFARDPESPKFSIISSLTNLAKPKNYMFRTYNLPPGEFSLFPGSCKHKMWEGIRASSAAPGFYTPFVIDGFAHQDGGMLNNNPTSIAIHECKLLWPNEDIQCVVSLGNGRYEPDLEVTSTDVSVTKQFSNMIESAADTEAIHIFAQDMLPSKTYYRFNPYISEDIQLNEIDPEKLNSMQQDAIMYLRRNNKKVEEACEQLMRPRGRIQKMVDRYDLFRHTEPLEKVEESIKTYKKDIKDKFIKTLSRKPLKGM